MTITGPSVRLLAVRKIAELCREVVDRELDYPERVQCVDHDPGAALRNEAIFVVDVEGDVEASAIAGGADMPTEDSFVVTLLCRVSIPGGTARSVMNRADELYQVVREVVLSVDYGSTLDELADDDGRGVVSFTELARVDGPLAAPTDDGYLGLYRVDVTITTDEVST